MYLLRIGNILSLFINAFMFLETKSRLARPKCPETQKGTPKGAYHFDGAGERT